MATPRGKPPGPTRFSEQLYQGWEKAMGAWWDQVLQSPSFLGAMSENLVSRTQARATYERTMEGAMDRMHLPTRKDIGRVARVATLLEERLLAQEDLLLSMKDQLAAAQRDAVQARIDTAQARLELKDQLIQLRGELASLQVTTQPAELAAPVEPPAPAAPASSPRKSRARRGAP
ncbi:MAG: hypothetical protein Q8P18_29125 [Pseudomonadota bacterium]|nr:hypothetical protein [Pseudomonadota bacterium]